ncbi:MAG: hypothetical protein J7K22_04735 [Nanoarchaeota archaeon]|nr:hypothetical protein [Nanoarchaeota archaeon]
MTKVLNWSREKIEIIKSSSASLFRKLSNLPPLAKWLGAVLVGGFLYKGVEIFITSYLKEIKTIEQVNKAIKIQFAIDIFIIVLLIVIISSLVKSEKL